METKLFGPVTGTATKSRLSGNMLPIKKTCENGWSNFSENLRIVALIPFTPDGDECVTEKLKAYSWSSSMRCSPDSECDACDTGSGHVHASFMSDLHAIWQ